MKKRYLKTKRKPESTQEQEYKKLKEFYHGHTMIVHDDVVTMRIMITDYCKKYGKSFDEVLWSF